MWACTLEGSEFSVNTARPLGIATRHGLDVHLSKMVWECVFHHTMPIGMLAVPTWHQREHLQIRALCAMRTSNFM